MASALTAVAKLTVRMTRLLTCKLSSMMAQTPGAGKLKINTIRLFAVRGAGLTILGNLPHLRGKVARWQGGKVARWQGGKWNFGRSRSGVATTAGSAASVTIGLFSCSAGAPFLPPVPIVARRRAQMRSRMAGGSGRAAFLTAAKLETGLPGGIASVWPGGTIVMPLPSHAPSTCSARTSSPSSTSFNPLETSRNPKFQIFWIL